MIADAIDAGFQKIHLEGIQMMDGEHEIFIKSVLKAMDYARSLGIEINARYEEDWRGYKTDKTIEQDYIELNRAEELKYA